MRTIQAFIFESFSFSPTSGLVELHYSLDGEIQFTERVKFARKGMHSKNVDPALLERALFALHLIGGISYFKTYCPKQIIVRSGTLSKEQAAILNEIYTAGLGEFFYRNNIDPRDLVRFPFEEEHTDPPYCSAQGDGSAFVPFGGGKDSIVTAELLRAAGMEQTLLRMNAHPVIDHLAATAALPLVSIERTIDPLLLQLNAEGALNGHVPITAYVSFLSILAALLYGKSAVIMSNEASASTGSMLYYGMEINHQWSKGLRCEQLVQEYARRFLTPDIAYFSLLRPLTELKIVELFARLPQYFFLTTSCNSNWRLLSTKRSTPLWCGSCPKCAFVFTMLAAFLPREIVLEIFKDNLFEKQSLLPTYRQLLGMEGFKPFECVGTPEETTAAFLLIRDRGEWNDTPIVQLFLREHLPHIADARESIDATLHLRTEHAIPPEYSTLLSSLS